MQQSLTWRHVLAGQKTLSSFQRITSFIAKERAAGVTIYPPHKEIFNAFRFTELHEVKVVIIGQDPYHGPNQAHGLSFSVNPGVDIPPSLRNIYKELSDDIPGFVKPTHGCLQSWAKQGVLLLNTILTVEAGRPYSHANLGWESFTDKVIAVINAYRKGIIFLLWGSRAQKKIRMIDLKRHHVLTAPHPSPISASLGFFGCNHFSKTNIILAKQRLAAINWIPALSSVCYKQAR